MNEHLYEMQDPVCLLKYSRAVPYGNSRSHKINEAISMSCKIRSFRTSNEEKSKKKQNLPRLFITGPSIFRE